MSDGLGDQPDGYYDHGRMVVSVRLRRTDGVSDDWLDTGHGPEASRLLTVFSRTPADRGETQTAAPRLRSAGPISVAVVLAAVMLVGSAGAVHAIRESLFPGMGAATPQSVWQNPAPLEPMPASTLALDIVPTTTSTTTTVELKPESSTTVPAVTRPTPTNTFDDRGSGASGTGSDDSGSGGSGPGSDDASGDDDSGRGSDDDEDDSGSDIDVRSDDG